MERRLGVPVSQRAPSGDRAETGDATPSYFDSDGEFGCPEDEEAYAQAARDGAEGDYAEPDGPDFETIPGELDALAEFQGTLTVPPALPPQRLLLLPAPQAG